MSEAGMETVILTVAPNPIIVGGLVIDGLAAVIHGGFKYSTLYSVAYLTVVTSALGLLPAMIILPLGVTLATE